jgi:hypothetical protein
MKDFYPRSKGDLFACFIERGFAFLKKYGFNSQVTMQGWLFIDTYKHLRAEILNNHSILNLIQIGFNSFPDLNSKYALAAAFTKRMKEKYLEPIRTVLNILRDHQYHLKFPRV